MTKIINEIKKINDEEFIECPVCGRTVELYGVCECNWENTGKYNIDGGPNELSLSEAIKAYKNGEKIY